MDFQALKAAAAAFIDDALPGGNLNAEWTPQNVDNAKFAAGFTPILGDALSAYDTIQAMRRGKYGDAALSAVGMLPFVPGVTKAVVGPFKGAITRDVVPVVNKSLINPHASFPHAPASAYDMGLRVWNTDDGKYVARYLPEWGSKLKEFHIVGDSPDDLFKAGVDRLIRSERSTSAAAKSKYEKSLIGQLEKEYGDVFQLAGSTQSKSQYITHLPSGTKIRVSDHDLPLHYEQPDVDFRLGTSVSDMMDKLRRILGN